MNKKKSNSDYPYNGVGKWNLHSIRRSVKKAKANSSLPDFKLERVEIHPTSLCQFSCPFCYGLNLKNTNKIELPLFYIKNNILKDIRNNKELSKYDPIIILAGLHSEPLLYKDKLELIKLLGKYNFRFSIYTNGECLDSNTMHVIFQSARLSKNKKLNYISFNITASILHNHYNSLVKSIEEFIKLKNKEKAPIQVNIPILIYDDFFSKKDLFQIQEKMLSIGVDKIRYSVPQEPVSNKNSINTKNIKFIKELEKRGYDKVYVGSKSGRQFDKCYVMANTVSIDYCGNVYPCSQTCCSFFSKFSYGSIKKKKLSEIWQSKKHRDLFNNFDDLLKYCRCNTADNQFNTICSSFE